MDSIKDKIEEIKDVKLVKENEDGTKQYVIEANGDTDLIKVIVSEFAKEIITNKLMVVLKVINISLVKWNNVFCNLYMLD